MDPEQLRASIPALDRTIYLNTGASGPSPRRVVEAAESFLELHEYESPARGTMGPYDAAWDLEEEARAAVADLLGAAPDEVALTQSTTDGINRVASAVDWAPGDAVVRTDLEHPGGILPWQRLADVADIEVRVVGSERGRLDVDAYREAVADARLVSVSSLCWTHGTRLPVRELVETAHDAGAQVLVDAVQSVGQTPVDVGEWGADFVAAGGHKWLLGLWGSGFLYVRDGAEETLAQRRLGYRGVTDPAAADYTFEPGARRLEIGTVSPVPYAALVEAIDVMASVGLETVEGRIREVAGRLADGLGDRLLSPPDPESGLVTFRVDDPEAFAERAAERGIILRPVPVDGAVRASVHAFNTPADVDAVLDLL